jgi:hypothetical protein
LGYIQALCGRSARIVTLCTYRVRFDASTLSDLPTGIYRYGFGGGAYILLNLDTWGAYI